MEKKELGLSPAGLAPRLKDLTPDELAHIGAGGSIECEIVGGRWVKRRVGPAANKRARPARRAAPELADLRRKLRALEG